MLLESLGKKKFSTVQEVALIKKIDHPFVHSRKCLKLQVIPELKHLSLECIPIRIYAEVSPISLIKLISR